MNKKFYSIILILLTISTISLLAKKEIKNDLHVIKGPYLGQKPPGLTPEIFAPGIVSTDTNSHSPAIFSKNGNELFWSYYDNGEHVIMYMHQLDGIWSKPEKFIHSNDLKDGNPFFSADWSKLFFHSGRRGKRKNGTMNIDFWYIEKNNMEWGRSKLLESYPNSDKWQLYGCQSQNGNFYYTSKLKEKSTEFQLYISRYNGKKWQKGELLPDIFNKSNVNWTPFVCPDESYIIFSSDRAGKKENGYNACDLFISFKNTENEWAKPVNMGKVINTDKIERFPWVSPDGKYLFFVRGFGNVYWVSAKIIKTLNTKILM